MSWMKIVLMIISILRTLKQSESSEVFAASAPAQKLQLQYGVNSDFLKKLWENREEVLAFILRLIELFDGTDDERQAFAAMLGQDELAS